MSLDRTAKLITGESIEFEALQKGDEFYLYEANGEPVMFNKVYTAISDATLTNDVWGIQVDVRSAS